MKDNNKMKPQRQAHRATNTFTFRGFGERVRRLRVSAGKFLLQRPRTEDGEETTFLHQALAKARELNLTQAFQDVQSELGGDLQSLAQLVHQEHRVGECLARHLADPDTTALQPILDLLVALASDLPMEFYQGHFYRLLPVLVGQLASREPERLEAVFLCLASLMVVVQRHLRADLHRLYHHEGYAALLAYARPWYINELAAQTLSFLVRKASGQEAFLQGVMKGLGQGPACPLGVGRLLAAMMKSDVVQRLHSSAGGTLAILLGLLGDGGLPRGPPLESITYAVVQVAHHVTTKHPDGATTWQAGWAQDAALVWPVVWQAVGAILPAATTAAAQHLEAVMQVAEAWVTYKQALLVTDPLEALAQCLAVAQCQVPEEVGATVCNVVVVLLTSPHHHIPNPSLRHTLHTLLASPLPHTTKITLIEQLFDLPSFDTQVLPEVLLYLDTLAGSEAGEAMHHQVLATLATLVLGKQPPCKSGMDLLSWKPYPLAFPQPEGGGEAAIPALLEDKLRAGLDQDMSNLEDLALCLLVVPHVSPLDHQALAPYLTWALSLLLESLTDPTHTLVLNHKPAPIKKKGKAKAEVALTLDLNVKCDLPLATRRSLALLGVLVEAMAHVLSGADLVSCLEPRQLVEVAVQRPQYRGNAHFLRALDLHLTVCRTEQCGAVMNQDTLREVYAVLAPCLASPHPQARLLVLHIFSLFPVTLAPPPEDAEAPESVFQVMLRAECVAVTPWEYKNRLRHLSSLDADHVAPHTPSCGSFREAPLLLLLGQLYINFKDMWEPALKGIASYAHSLPDTHFWPLWFSQLCIASHHTRQVLQGKEVDPDQALSLEEPLLEEELHRLAAHQGFAKIPLQPDHLNYRNLLWRAMALFPGVCEARNRDVVPLFFLFLEAELYPADSTVAPTQDLTHRRTQDHAGDPVEATTQAGHGQGKDTDDDDREAKCAEGHETQASTGTQALSDTHDTTATASQPRRAPIKSLCEQLTLLSKFHNPRMVLHSQRLEDTYNQLLSHPLPGVQRLALDCLMSYGHGHLTPYREGLYNILDDRSFKHALTLFSIDGSEQSLEEEHRAGLLPCLLRLLYGKMYHKTGPNTAGRGKIAARKAVVLRFLAGAREAELGTFLDLSFEVVAPHLHGPPPAVVARARAALDPRQTVPPSRLLSVLTTVQNVVDKIGNLLEERIPHLLKVTLYVASVADGLLGRRAQISPRHVALLKHLRQLAQRQVATFFRQFADYPWSGEEVEAVFEACVWPGLPRLPDEGLASPSPLLGLFSCWAQHPRYMPLLARHHPDHPSLTPLPYLVALLRHPKCSDTVASAVLGLVEDLLTLADPAPGEVEPLPPGLHMIPVEHRPSRDGGEAMNYGTALLGPHLDTLLQSLGTHLAKVGQGKPVATRDLTILTSLTRWVGSAEVSAELLNLIVPVVAKKQVKQEEKVAQLLAACCHLLAVVPDPQHHLRSLTSLLGWVAHRQAREHLCRALGVLASRSPDLHHLATTAEDLNAWSPRAVEEVDFERRLACYSALTPVLAGQDTLDLPLSLLLVHHNMFVLQHQEDAALRDVAALCLTQLVEACARLQHTQRAVAKEVVVDRLLPLVRTALRGEREAVRLETVAVLRQVVHACPGLHPQLADLHQLADLEDEEVDFFSNLQHIQRHRRSRALTRLVERVTGGTLSLAPDTLTSYILPLAAPYLFKDEYVSDEYLMGSCVATVGAVAGQLPWHPYQRLLRYYLGLMLKGELKHLRLGVKVIDAILGAFHEEVEECAWQGKAKEGRRARRQRQAEAKAGEQEEAARKQKDKDTAEQGGKGEDNKDPKIEDAEEQKEEEEEKDDAGKEEKEGKQPEDPSAVPLRRAQKVYRALVGSVIPQIQRTLGLRMRAETEHKLNRSRFPEDEDIKRIPLAFALIKLLKKMPRQALNAHVNGVLMKIITFLKCKAEGIREEARNMLVRIMVELGGHYLAWLVNDMRAILTRGFQTHVLVYTLHAVLHTLRPTLTAENVDACTTGVVEVCREDLLGVQAEEKKVKEITGKVKEARGDRSYDILGFVAEHMSTQGLREVMVPLTEVLSQTQDRQVVAKMARCLARVAAGLQRNRNVDVTQKSLFVYGIMNEKLPEMRLDGAEKKPRRKGKVERADSFLLLPEPQRARLNPKTSLKATAHILMEFALQLLCSLMRQGQLLPSDPAHAALLDPYLASMTRCINSDHPEVSIQALKCVNWLVKFPLPSLHTELKKICTQMFVVLHKYSSPELARGKLYDLVQLSFKSLAVVVRSVDAHMLSEEELEVLLGYVTSCLEDTRQQQTAFGVLQAVLSRKVDCPSLHQLLGRVKQMSITCGRSFPLQQARVTYHTYLLTYPMKPQRITTNIHYFLDNVAFPVEEGRLSAATMIQAVTANFPAKLITRQLETDLWFKVAEQLAKEHSREVRALLHKILKTLFERSVRREVLLDLCMKLLAEPPGAAPDHMALQVAAKSLSAFLDVPVKLLPKSLLSAVLPQVSSLVHPTRYTTTTTTLEACGDVQQMDTTLVCLLEVLGKLAGAFLPHPEWSVHARDEVWESVQSHLSYPHLHVRVSVAGLVGQLLAAHPVEGDTCPPIAATPQAAMELAKALCELLRTQAGTETHLLTQLSLAAVRNLIYLIRHSLKVPLGRHTPRTDSCVRQEGKQQQHQQHEVNGEDEAKDVTSESHQEDLKAAREDKSKNTDSKEGRMSAKRSKVLTETKTKRRRTGSGGREEQSDGDSSTEATETGQRTPTEPHHGGQTGGEEGGAGKGRDTGATGDRRPLVTAAVWVLHQVGNIAYEELQTSGSERTVTREALLNLMAGLIMVAGEDAKAPRLLTYIIKHLARELTDDHLPEPLKERTREVAALVKEKVGVETYTRHLSAAQTALSRKRLDRRAHEMQQKVVNPELAQRRKRKKQDNLKDNRKRRIAERKGKVVKGGKGAKGSKGKAMTSKKRNMMDEVVVRE